MPFEGCPRGLPADITARLSMIFLRPTRYVEDDAPVPATPAEGGTRRITALTLARSAMTPAQLRAELDKAVDPHCLEEYYWLYPARAYRRSRSF